jgi:hypothetical protein
MKSIQQKYEKHLQFWERFKLDFEMCVKCKERKVLPIRTTTSLPLKPMWPKDKNGLCMVCEWYLKVR